MRSSAMLVAYPSPFGLVVISTVTATTSDTAAARRRPASTQGSAAGSTILVTRDAETEETERARHFQNTRLGPAHVFSAMISSDQMQAKETTAISMQKPKPQIA